MNAPLGAAFGAGVSPRAARGVFHKPDLKGPGARDTSRITLLPAFDDDGHGLAPRIPNECNRDLSPIKGRFPSAKGWAGKTNRARRIDCLPRSIRNNIDLWFEHAVVEVVVIVGGSAIEVIYLRL